MVESRELRDFFVSYTQSDLKWADWIKEILEEAGYSVFLQDRDFPPGSHWPFLMDEALKKSKRIVAVLSPAYLNSDQAASEWLDACRTDPLGHARRLIPIRVEQCALDGLIASRVYADIVGMEQAEARRTILKAVNPVERLTPNYARRVSEGSIQPAPFPGKPASPKQTCIYELVLNGKLEFDDGNLPRLLENLKAWTSDIGLKIKKIRVDSARILLEGTEQGYLRLADLMEKRLPIEVLKLRVSRLDRLDPQVIQDNLAMELGRFEKSAHPVLVLDQEGQLAYLNREAALITGLAAGGGHFLPQIPEASRTDAEAAFATAWENTPHSFDLRFDGDLLKIQSSPWKSSEGEVYLVCFLWRASKSKLGLGLNIVTEIAQDSASQNDFRMVFYRFFKRVETRVDHVTITVYDQKKICFRVHDAYSRRMAQSEASNIVGEEIPIKGFPVQERIYSERRPVIAPIAEFHPIAEESGAVTELVGRNRVKSMLIVPMVYRGATIGTLSVDCIEKYSAFFEDDVELFQTIANQMAVAMENAKMQEAMEKQQETIRNLEAFSRKLGRYENLEEVADQFLKGLHEKIDFKRGSLQIIDDDGKRLLAGSFNFDKSAADPFFLRPIREDALALLVVNKDRGKPLLIPDTDSSPFWSRDTRTRDVKSWIGAPIRLENSVVGMVTLDHEVPNKFTEETAEIVRLFCETVALQVHRSYHQFTAERKIRSLGAINQVAQKIGTQIDSEVILDTIIGELRMILGGSRVGMFLQVQDGMDAPNQGTAAVQRPAILEDRAFPQRRLEIRKDQAASTSPLETVCITGKALLLPDANQFTSAENRAIPERRGPQKARALVAAPICAGTQTIGVLYACHDRAGYFRDSDLELVRALALHAGIAIDRDKGLRLLGEINNQILQASSVQQILVRIISGAVDLTNSDVSDIYLFDQSRTQILHTFTTDKDKRNPPPRMNSGVTRRIIESGETVVIPDTMVDTEVNPKVREVGIMSLIGVPMIIEDRVEGVFFVCDRSPRVYSQTESSFLKNLATQGSIALKKARLLEENERSKNRLQSLVESMPFYMFRKNRDHEFTFANSAFLAAIGKPPEEVIGKTDFDLYGKENDNAKKYWEVDEFVFRTKEAKTSREEHFLLAKGQTIWVDCFKTPVLNDQGVVVEIQGVFWDVTQSKELQERYEALVEQSPYGIIVHKNGTICLANSAAMKILNFKGREELLTYQIIDLVHPDSRPLAEERFQKMLRGEPVKPGEELKLINPSSPGKPVRAKVFSRHSGSSGEIQVIIKDLGTMDLN